MMVTDTWRIDSCYPWILRQIESPGIITLYDKLTINPECGSMSMVIRHASMGMLTFAFCSSTTNGIQAHATARVRDPKVEMRVYV